MCQSKHKCITYLHDGDDDRKKRLDLDQIEKKRKILGDKMEAVGRVA
jgi:hypothetical protein